MATVNTSDNRYGTAQLIVAPTIAEGANYTTVQSAINAAVSGQTVFIRPGTYAETITLKAGVNLAAYECDQYNHVIIRGNCTATFGGTATFSGIQFQASGAASITASGSNATILRFTACYFNALDTTSISFSVSNTSARLFFDDCLFDLGTTGIASYTMSSTGEIHFNFCELRNTGGSSTANTNSAGNFILTGGYHFQSFATSSTGNGVINNVNISPGNVTAITTAGTGTMDIANSYLNSGSASAMSIGSGTGASVHSTVIQSSNTNAVTGAGTFKYSGVSFAGSSGTVNTSTQTNDTFGPVIKIPAGGSVLYNTGAGALGVVGTNDMSIYEQGTFTPTLTNSGTAPTVTYSVQVGRYTRIGNRVFCMYRVVLSAYTAGTGNMGWSTLPFTANNTTNNINVGPLILGAVTFDAAVLYYQTRINANTTGGEFIGIRTGAATLSMTAAAPGATASFNFSIEYEV